MSIVFKKILKFQKNKIAEVIKYDSNLKKLFLHNVTVVVLEK